MNYQKVALSPGLTFVGVPIGSARDITLRALDVLASADVLVAEDTRSLRRLMDIHAIPLAGRPLISLHEHSNDKAIAQVLNWLADGKSVAYASEAGMPLIADPGFELARAVSEAGNPVTTAPGPSAAITALVTAGLPTDAFFFAGFLPSSAAARRAALETLRDIPGTLVFYESPKRLAAFLTDAGSVLGEDRLAAVCRELTKKFEEIRKGSLRRLCEEYAATPAKGEIVILIDRERSEKITEIDLEKELKRALEEHSTKDAAELVARAFNVPRRQVYQMALSLAKG